MPLEDANQVGAAVGHHLIQSLHDPARYPHGTVSFAGAQFLADRIAQNISSNRITRIIKRCSDIEGLNSATFAGKLQRARPDAAPSQIC